jgi:hypothetical protein
MAQISKGDTFTDGEQVTGARLNQLVDSSTLLVGAITDQPSITANTLEATDSTIVNDAGTLKEATIGDILNSNLPISTSSITGGTGVDIVVTPAVGQKVDIAGAVEAESINSVANTTIGGTLTVTGASTLTGNVVVDNGLTSNGVANFTGTLQVNGTVGYVLTEVAEETITTYTTASLPASWTTAWTSASYTKAAGEIWVIESCFNWQRNVLPFCAIRLKQTSSSTDLAGLFDIEGAGSAYIHHEQAVFRYVVPASTTFTSTFTMDAIASTAGYSFELGCTAFGTAGIFTGITIPSSKFRIYKYKTA